MLDMTKLLDRARPSQPGDAEPVPVMIDPARGFAPGNVVLVSTFVARLLDACTPEERTAVLAEADIIEVPCA